MDLARCDEIGQRQDGLITRRQALEVLSHGQIDTLLRRNVWTMLYPSVFRMHGVPATWTRRVRGATLGREDATASHSTAAHLWGLLERDTDDVHVLCAESSSARLPGVHSHRSRSWTPEMRQHRSGIPVTPPARTLVDIAPSTSMTSLGRALDAAITTGIMSSIEFMNEVENMGRGRRKPDYLETLAEERLGSDVVESSGEALVLRWIAAAGLPAPTPQLRVPISQCESYRLDFAYTDLRIAIEVQSWRWHGGPVQYRRDSERSIKLAALGWTTLPVLPRFENERPFIAALRGLLDQRRMN
jgi:hypothetical protein